MYVLQIYSWSCDKKSLEIPLEEEEEGLMALEACKVALMRCLPGFEIKTRDLSTTYIPLQVIQNSVFVLRKAEQET